MSIGSWSQVTQRRGGGGRGPVLLTSSCGGHFTELGLLADRWEPTGHRRHWAVARTAQTEAELAGPAALGRVSWVPQVDSRDLGHAVGNLGAALQVHQRVRPAVVLSTGAAQAVPHLLAAALHRTPIVYVESVARQEGPSLTGRIAARLPYAALFAQAEPSGLRAWGPGWRAAPDVFSSFDVVPSPGGGALDRAVVALGTEQFPFPRLAAQAGRLLGPAEVTWQVGRTDFCLGDDQLNRWLAPALLAERMRDASVVVVHGGAGSILMALAAGKVPVVLPRSPEHGEHVDDHQLRMCAMLQRRGLAVVVGPGEPLTVDHLAAAAARCAVPATVPSSSGTGGPGAVRTAVR